jgi:HEAT repeat protein
MKKLDSSLSENFRKNLIHYLSQGDIDQATAITRKAAGAWSESPQILGTVMGQTSAFLYDNFFVKAVEQYYKTIPPHISGEISGNFKAALEERIRLTHEWRKKLKNLSMERMAREIRDAIRTKDYGSAIQLCIKLVNEGENGEPDLQRAILLGNIFGTLENVQDHVEKVLIKLSSHFPARIIESIKANQKERLTLIYKSQLENRNLEWMRNLTIATAEIKRYLPLSTVAGEPDSTDFEKFDLLIRSIVRCYYMPPYSLYDIINLMVEFCPHEVSLAGAASGMESRLFNALNPTQRRVVIDVLTVLGKNKSFISEVIKFSRANQGTRYQQLAIEILGGLKAERAVDYLLECLKDKKLRTLRPTVIASLGSLTHSDVQEVLKDLLKSLLQTKAVGPQIREEISNVLLSLAKISRNLNISNKQRNGIIRDVIEILDDKDSRVSAICAENFFLTRQNEIEADLRTWAVERLVEGLWFKDTSPDFAKGSRAGESSQRTLLGKKEALVDLLSQLGQEFLPSMISTAELRMIHYGSAYLAVAEVMSRIGDERAVPLLDKLLSITLTTNEKELGKYEKEHYWDSAEEAQMFLEKDKIVHAIVYALNKIRGNTADCVLEDLYQKFQAGQYPIPGKETGDLVYRIYQRIKEERGDIPDKEIQGDVEREISRDMIEQSLKILNKSFIFSDAEKRRLHKVGALQILGRAKAPDALWDIVSHLEDKDPMIVSATMAAIVDYNSPPMEIEKLRYFLNVLVSKWESGSFDMKQKIEKIMERLQPERDMMKERIREIIKTESDHKVRYYLERLFVNQLAPREENREESKEAGSEGGEDLWENEGVSAKLAELEQKRRYLDARRKWISGGKKGDPPRYENF